MMTTRGEILERLRADKAKLDAFGIRSVAVFGSCARGDARADVRPDLFDFIDLQDHLRGLLGRPVDLVTPEAMSGPLRARVLAEAVYA